MKNILSFVAIIFSTTGLFAQTSVGLVAHWDMNGSVSDVSGNGHDGHANYVTPAAGKSGMPNTAYRFNGFNSIITAPYMPDLNLTEYSICATLKIEGFYNGLCQSNYIVARGSEMGAGKWGLRFDDNAFNDCYVIDSTKEVFIATAGLNAPTTSADAWQYTPTIVKNEWYSVVVTYSSPTWRVYVNCNLVNTITGTGIPIGTSLDSIAIGLNVWNGSTTSGYPYPFKGLIDDIRIYNRVLHDSELAQYCDTCGFITLHPADTSTSSGSTVSFTTATTISTPYYQWQRDTGTGFMNLLSSGTYSGVNTATLTVTGITAAMSGHNFRCVISNEFSCSQTSAPAALTIPANVRQITGREEVRLYPNPALDRLNITIPSLQGAGQFELLDQMGRLVHSLTITEKDVQIDLADIDGGMYIARILFNGQVVVRKVIRVE